MLVELFVALVPRMRAEIAAELPAAARPLEEGPASGSTAAGLVPAHATAFENIALAHRELYALYEIAQTMGTSLGVADTMALISAKLTKLDPVVGLLAVPAAARRRDPQVPLRHRCGNAAAPGHDPHAPSRGWRDGFPGTAARS